MNVKKEEFKTFSVKFPKVLTEEIDQICKHNYITRTSWLIRAAKFLLEKERMESTDEIIKKITEKEQ